MQRLNHDIFVSVLTKVNIPVTIDIDKSKVHEGESVNLICQGVYVYPIFVNEKDSDSINRAQKIC